MAKVVLQPRRSFPLSPLRYPGGKGGLADFLGQLMARKGLTRYAEPYAGGAGAAIDLLLSGAADSIVINDLDPAIHSFWHSVLNDTDNLVQRIASTPLTVEQWRHQRSIYQAKDVSDPTHLGFATLYLNRTNRSGVMNAGVIGGREQAGKYKIGARFEPERISARIRRIAERRDAITLLNLDGADVIESELSETRTLVYADPPYFEKGSTLYLNSFTEGDHDRLAQILNSRPMTPWILTYDDHLRIRELYADRDIVEYRLDYSAHRREKASELMVVSEIFRDMVSSL